MSALFLALAAAAATPIAAAPVKDQPAVTLDPAKAYVYYQANKLGTAVKLIREPSQKDIDDYAQRRAEAFAKAQKRYLREHKQWIALTQAAAGGGPGARPGPEPVEPKEATFAIEPMEMGLMVDVGPLNRFSKGVESSSYLWAIEPGVYRVYGPVVAPTGVMPTGTCMCMGTVKFEVTAGAITDMGKVVLPFYEATVAAKDGTGERLKTALELPEGRTSFAIDPARAGDAIDPRVGSFPVRPAVYHASGRMPNFYGLEIDRLQALPGALRYDRDKIIDEASGQEVK